MEKTSRLSHKLSYLSTSLALAIPLVGSLIFSKGEIVSSDLTDTIVLAEVFPDFMKLFFWLHIAALVFAFIPALRQLYALTIGLAMGGLVFHALDMKSNLLAMNDLGVSTQPVEDLVTILPYGKLLIANFLFIILCQLALSIKNLLKNNRNRLTVKPLPKSKHLLR